MDILIAGRNNLSVQYGYLQCFKTLKLLVQERKFYLFKFASNGFHYVHCQELLPIS